MLAKASRVSIHLTYNYNVTLQEHFTKNKHIKENKEEERVRR